jgi:hypothetical protein
MVMIPELDFGFFASTNTNTGFGVIRDLPAMIVERYLEPRDTPGYLVPPADFAERGERFSGSYISNRRSYTKLEKFAAVFMDSARVSLTKDGYLVVSSPGGAIRFVEVDALTFRQADGEDILKFIEDESGKITGFVTDDPDNVMDRAGLFEDRSRVINLSAIALLVCVGVLIAAWYRRRQRIEQATGERLASALLWLTALIWLGFAIPFGLAMAEIAGNLEAAMYSYPSSMLVNSLAVACVATVLTLIDVLFLYSVWSRRSWATGRRLRHTLAVLVFAVLVLMLHDLNAIGFNYF